MAIRTWVNIECLWTDSRPLLGENKLDFPQTSIQNSVTILASFVPDLFVPYPITFPVPLKFHGSIWTIRKTVSVESFTFGKVYYHLKWYAKKKKKTVYFAENNTKITFTRNCRTRFKLIDYWFSCKTESVVMLH